MSAYPENVVGAASKTARHCNCGQHAVIVLVVAILPQLQGEAFPNGLRADHIRDTIDPKVIIGLRATASSLPTVFLLTDLREGVNKMILSATNRIVRGFHPSATAVLNKRFKFCHATSLLIVYALFTSLHVYTD